jgi:ketosteroid isomerase-like protein
VTDDEAEIRALLERWASAVRTREMAGILADHADDIVMFDVPKPLQSRGIDAYRGTWELFFRYSNGGPNAFNIIEMDVVAGDRVAFCNAILGIEKSRLRLTVGLRKDGGRWVVAHEHHSYPADID